MSRAADQRGAEACGCRRIGVVENRLDDAVIVRPVLQPVGQILLAGGDKPARLQLLVKDVDKDVEHRAGQRLRQLVLVAPARDEIEQRERIGRQPDLLVVDSSAMRLTRFSV